MTTQQDGMSRSASPDGFVYVMGRLSADIYPQQIETLLEDVRTFDRFVGGFAGNVSVGLGRLGVPVKIVSAVGDDGHGRYIRKTLQAEGVDVSVLGTHPTLRTALAFCEMWPPEHFPITFYREPTCPDWELRPNDVPMDEMASAPLVYTTGTGLARDPSRSTHLAVLERRLTERERAPGGRHQQIGTILDLDWRAVFWPDPADYARQIRLAARLSDIVMGSDSEFEAASLTPDEAFRLGARVVVVKHGGEGATVLENGQETHVPGIKVQPVNGLGAGDAFAASFGAGLMRSLTPAEAVRRANAAGAIVVTRVACSAAMPTSAEIDALLEGASVVDGVVQGVPV